MKKEIFPVLRVASLGHGIHAFVNGEYLGKCSLHTERMRLWCTLNSKQQIYIALRTSFSLLYYLILVFCFLGAAHGSKVEKSFVFQKPAKFEAGTNHIALLGVLVGLPVRLLQLTALLGFNEI